MAESASSAAAASKLLEINLIEEGSLPIIRTSTGTVSPSRPAASRSQSHQRLPEGLPPLPAIPRALTPSSGHSLSSPSLEVPIHIAQVYFSRSPSPPDETNAATGLQEHLNPNGDNRTSANRENTGFFHKLWRCNVKIAVPEPPTRIEKFGTIRFNQFDDSEVEYHPHGTHLITFVWIVLAFVEFAIWHGWEFASFAENPFIGLPENAKVQYGAVRLSDSFGKNNVARMFGSVFVHAGWVDLVFNCFGMIKFGRRFEKSEGLLKMLAVSTISGIFAVSLSAIINPHTAIPGATAVTFSLCGAMMADLWVNRNVIQRHYRRNLLQYVFAVGLALYFGILPALSNWVTISSFVAGFSCEIISHYVFSQKEIQQEEDISCRIWKTSLRPALLCLIPMFIHTLVVVRFLLLTGQPARNIHHTICDTCLIIECVPSSFWVCYN